MHLVFSVTVIVVLHVASALSQGQQNATCGASWSWLDNQDGLSPCDVAFTLLDPCSIGTAFWIAPLDAASGTGSYSNPWGGQNCSCNTVSYNAMSACGLCQGGSASDFSQWMSNCSTVDYTNFPSALPDGVKVPKWAFVNVSSSGTFNLAAVEAASNQHTGWTTIEIVTPILVALVLLLLGTGAFFLYRRRWRRRYKEIRDPAPSQSPFSPPLSKKRLQRAWTQARLGRPRRWGFLPSVNTVRTAHRSDTWSIDLDADAQGRHQPSTSVTSLFDARDSQAQGYGHGRRPSGHAEETPVPPPASLPAIQDSPNLNTSRPTRGVAHEHRSPPVHVVSAPARRGFHIDGSEGAASPTTHVPPPVPVLAAPTARRDTVILISGDPGDAMSPTESVSFPSFIQDSSDHQSDPANASSVLLPSISRAPRTPSPLPNRKDPVMLFPQSVRSAGYTGSSAGLPSAAASSHSSDYNTPNPFTFDARRGGYGDQLTVRVKEPDPRRSPKRIPVPDGFDLDG